MFLIELLHHFLNAIDLSGTPLGSISCTLGNFVSFTPTCKNPFGIPLYDAFGNLLPGSTVYEGLVNCPSYAITPIAAAFATQGYWVQSDIIHWLMDTNPDGYTFGMGLLAPLAYLLSAIAGLVSMGLGQPPRQYLWFFAGPAIYSWLIGTPSEPIVGVQWRVGGQDQDMREVWKLAEQGLTNTGAYGASYLRRVAIPFIQVPIVYDPEEGASRPGVHVSEAFAWYDSLLSEVIDETIRWLGVFRTGVQDTVSDFLGRDMSTLPGADIINQPIGWSPDTSKWFLLSNLKWGILHNITDAQVNDPDLRNSLTSFMNSECFDAIKDNVSSSAYQAAALGKPQSLPMSVFRCSTPLAKDCDYKPDWVSLDSPNASHTPDVITHRTYRNVFNRLKSQPVPVPDWLRSLVSQSENQPGSFTAMFDFNDVATQGAFKTFRGAEEIACSDFLALVISGFRWEAGHNYANLARDIPDMFGAASVECTDYMAALPHNLFYGWDVKRCLAYDLNGTCVDHPHKLTRFENINFIQDLMLLSMLKNELRWMPPVERDRYSEAQKTVQNAQMWQRNGAGQSKFGEVYSWALMVPYFQGILLYLLAIGYPFACILVVVPGMHRAILTWATFWAWAKMWDLGFAIAMSMERSVWGMIGNSSNAAKLFQKVLDMQIWATTAVGCPDGSADGRGFTITDKLNCVKAGTHAVRIGGPLSDAVHSSLYKYDVAGGDNLVVTSLKILDRAMVLGSSMDLDLANSYYIYIMSALYFAVPAVTGQLVLGAKAGASSLVNSAMGSNAQEAGRGAQSAWLGEQSTRQGNTRAVADQAQLMKAARTSGENGSNLMSNAAGTGVLDFANQSGGMGMTGRAYDTANSIVSGPMATNLGNSRDIIDSRNNVMAQGGQMLANWGADVVGKKDVGSLIQSANRSLGATRDSRGASLAGGGGEAGNAHTGESATGNLNAGGGDLAGASGATHANQSGDPGGVRTSSNNTGTAGVRQRAQAVADSARGPVAKGLSMAGDLAGLAGAIANFNNRDQNFKLQSGIQASSAALQNESFANSQGASGLNSHASRAQQGVGFKTETGRFRAMQSWGEGSASRLAGAMGMSPGSTSAGSLSNSLEGAAMNGMLGSGAKTAANYFNPAATGGFFAQRDQQYNGIGQNFVAPVYGMYSNTSGDPSKRADLSPDGMRNAIGQTVNPASAYTTPGAVTANSASVVSSVRSGAPLDAPAAPASTSSGDSGQASSTPRGNTIIPPPMK